jgi:predicted PurR-regulated permease PerM
METPEPSQPSSARNPPRVARRSDAAREGRPFYSVNLRSVPVTGIFLLLVLFALKLGSSFFIPVVLAVLLKFLFASVVRWLNRFYVPSGVGAALIILFLLGSVGTAIYQLAAPAQAWMAKLPHTLRIIDLKLRDFKKSMQQISQATKAVDRLTNLGGEEKAQKVEVHNPKLGDTLLSPMHDFLVGAGIVLILLFFLLASGDLFLRKVVAALRRFADKKMAVEITHQIEHDISTYLLAITLINALFGAAVGTALYFLGLPNPILWGVMAGFLHFIPFLGAVVGISVVTLVALVAIDEMTIVLLVPAVYFSLNLLEEYLLLPFVLGRRLMLNPVVLLLWVIFWAWFWGVPGALMAVPSLAILKIVSDHVEPLAPLGEFIAR